MTQASFDPSVLAAYAKQYEKPIQGETITVRLISDKPAKPIKAPREPKVAKVKAPKGKTSTATAKVDPTLPIVGTIDAVGFSMQIASAGKRLVEREVKGIKLTLPSYMGDIVRRDDEILAIAAFVGYDRRQPHGTQLDNARSRARFAICPELPIGYHRGTRPTLDGFISGMPDGARKVVLDLLAREKFAADGIADQEAKAHLATETQARAEARALAASFAVSLHQLRADLRSHGVAC